MINKEQLAADLSAVKEQSPLVHNITNYVAMNFSANALLAVGAEPVMAHAVEEMVELVNMADALVINIGTLDQQWVEGMVRAGERMHELGRPVILDPVGAGTSSYRTQVCWSIIERCRPTIIRGNASEIVALANSKSDEASTAFGVECARELALGTGSVVVVSGPTDYITDGERIETISNGSPLMGKVTAMGSTTSSMVGVFAAVNDDPMEAALHAMAVMSVAGERAAARSQGPGSLLGNFVDELYNLTPELLGQEVRQ